LEIGGYTRALRIRTLRRWWRLLVLFGSVATATKLLLVIKQVGLPRDLSYLYVVRVAYLSGDVRIPGLVDFVGRYSLLGACVVGGIWYGSLGIVWPVIGSLAVISINNVAIGGRGDLIFGAVVAVSAALVLRYSMGKSLWVIVFRRTLGLVLLFLGAFTIAVFVGRHGYDLRSAVDDAVLYLAANIPATAWVARLVYSGDLSPSGPVMTLGGVLRFASEVLNNLGLNVTNPPVDMGYVPVYADIEGGVNTYTYVAYLVSDWGLEASLLFSFLIGLVSSWALVSAKRSRQPFWISTAIAMVTLLLTSPLYLASKLISWWMIWLIGYIVLRSCLTHSSVAYS